MPVPYTPTAASSLTCPHCHSSEIVNGHVYCTPTAASSLTCPHCSSSEIVDQVVYHMPTAVSSLTYPSLVTLLTMAHLLPSTAIARFCVIGTVAIAVFSLTETTASIESRSDIRA